MNLGRITKTALSLFSNAETKILSVKTIGVSKLLDG